MDFTVSVANPFRLHLYNQAILEHDARMLRLNPNRDMAFIYELGLYSTKAYSLTK